MIFSDGEWLHAFSMGEKTSGRYRMGVAPAWRAKSFQSPSVDVYGKNIAESSQGKIGGVRGRCTIPYVHTVVTTGEVVSHSVIKQFHHALYCATLKQAQFLSARPSQKQDAVSANTLHCQSLL